MNVLVETLENSWKKRCTNNWSCCIIASTNKRSKQNFCSRREEKSSQSVIFNNVKWNSVLHELKLISLNGACAQYCFWVETKCRFWVVSSVVELLFYTEIVGGSIPSRPTISKHLREAPSKVAAAKWMQGPKVSSASPLVSVLKWSKDQTELLF